MGEGVQAGQHLGCSPSVLLEAIADSTVWCLWDALRTQSRQEGAPHRGTVRRDSGWEILIAWCWLMAHGGWCWCWALSLPFSAVSTLLTPAISQDPWINEEKGFILPRRCPGRYGTVRGVPTGGAKSPKKGRRRLGVVYSTLRFCTVLMDHSCLSPCPSPSCRERWNSVGFRGIYTAVTDRLPQQCRQRWVRMRQLQASTRHGQREEQENCPDVEIPWSFSNRRIPRSPALFAEARTPSGRGGYKLDTAVRSACTYQRAVQVYGAAECTTSASLLPVAALHMAVQKDSASSILYVVL